MTRYTGRASAALKPAETTGDGVELTVAGVVLDILSTVKVETLANLMRTNEQFRLAMVTVVLPLFTTPQLLADMDGNAILDADGNEQFITPIAAADFVGAEYRNGKQVADSQATLEANGFKIESTEKWVNTHLGKVNKKTGQEIDPCLVRESKIDVYLGADAIVGLFHKRSRGSNGGIYTLANLGDKIEWLKQELGL